MGAQLYSIPVTITATPPLWVSSEVNTTGLLCLLSSLSSLQYPLRTIIALSVCPVLYLLPLLPLCASLSVCLAALLSLLLLSARLLARSVALALSLPPFRPLLLHCRSRYC